MKIKSLVLSLLMVMAISIVANAADFAAKEGQITTKEFGKVKVHDYASKTGAHAQVIENDKLVIFDVFGNAPINNDFKAFADSLGKPIEKVIITHRDEHHWIGIDSVFPNVEIFSADADAINAEGAKMLEKAIADSGKDAIPYTTAPKVSKIADGKQVFDGVEYVFTSYPFQAWTIEMPAQKLALAHHLGYVGLHLPMPPLDERLAVLKKLQTNGDTFIIGGHGMPADTDTFVKAVEAYYSAVKKAVAESKTVEEAKAKIIAEFPKNNAPFFLDMMLPVLMQK